MLAFVDPTTIPPGGFKYLQKETNATIYAASLHEMLGKVRQHRIANNLPIPIEWKLEIENSMCTGMPPGTCRHLNRHPSQDVVLQQPHRPLQMAEMLSGVKVLGSWMWTGFQKVDQDEANRRSSICAACPLNQPSGGCSACASNAMREAVEQILGRSRTVAHDNISVCHICGCSLKVAVWVPIDLLLKHKPQGEQRPEWCWLKE
jgi:hypothetical protein